MGAREGGMVDGGMERLLQLARAPALRSRQHVACRELLAWMLGKVGETAVVLILNPSSREVSQTVHNTIAPTLSLGDPQILLPVMITHIHSQR